ncbi:MAG: hypothetical protein OM95_10125 [Bdellovibrio sp. ArHS]|uniref:L,D-transpeptidase n=1 Tax=Bdellovibrio sp. ArHS TaxID=1569284 RepID=UPI000583D9BC|nr:L,D-transpeptidase [Bdellovibrio sp. ArHS]KHD88252.1 MAG: hypothetical protein OM95_10125 [Bdellovibrio sp. ArHS]
MKKYLMSFMLLMSLTTNAQESADYRPLDDLMSPDEIAEENGFPRTEIPLVIKTVEDVARTEALDIFREYPVILIINKKESGPGAQRMKVYLNGYLTYDWPVSTGRERWETAKSGRTYFSVTPAGFFYPYMLNKDHYSETWQTPMPYSVFFNGGIAVHATTPGLYKYLGTRASGGCVRLHHENAAFVFNRIQSEGRGLVPVINRNGTVSRDRRGNVIRRVNYRTLVIVEDR